MTVFDDAVHNIDTLSLNLTALDSTVQGSPQLNVPALSDLVGEAHDVVTRMYAAVQTLAANQPLPPLKGLFTEGAYQRPPSVMNMAISFKWRDLQASPNGEILPNNPLDRQLAKGLPFHARIMMGRYSPDFALAAGGGVDIHDPTDGVSAKCIRWYRDDIMAWQADFWAKMAVKYDGKVPLFFVANGMTVYAEPCIRDIGDATSRKNLLAAGYTKDKDLASWHAMFDMLKVFRRSGIGVAYNPFQYINSNGTGASDVNIANSLMDEHYDKLGPLAHWQNNSIRTPSLPGYKDMYAHQKGFHRLGYQTATQPRVGDYAATLAWAVAQGAHSVELSPRFDDPSLTPHLTSAQLSGYDTMLRQNP